MSAWCLRRHRGDRPLGVLDTQPLTSSMETMPIALDCLEQLEEQFSTSWLRSGSWHPRGRGGRSGGKPGVFRSPPNDIPQVGVSDDRVGGVHQPLEVVRDAEGDPPLGDSHAGRGGLGRSWGRDRGETGFSGGSIGKRGGSGTGSAWSGSLLWKCSQPVSICPQGAGIPDRHRLISCTLCPHELPCDPSVRGIPRQPRTQS